MSRWSRPVRRWTSPGRQRRRRGRRRPCSSHRRRRPGAGVGRRGRRRRRRSAPAPIVAGRRRRRRRSGGGAGGRWPCSSPCVVLDAIAAARRRRRACSRSRPGVDVVLAVLRRRVVERAAPVGGRWSRPSCSSLRRRSAALDDGDGVVEAARGRARGRRPAVGARVRRPRRGGSTSTRSSGASPTPSATATSGPAGPCSTSARHIARELHDVVAHHVSLIGVQAGAARDRARPVAGRHRAALAAIEAPAASAVGEMRQLLDVLRADDDARRRRAAARARPTSTGSSPASAPPASTSPSIGAGDGRAAAAARSTCAATASSRRRSPTSPGTRRRDGRRVDVDVGADRGPHRRRRPGTAPPDRRRHGGRGRDRAWRERVALFGGALAVGPVARRRVRGRRRAARGRADVT